MKVSASMLKEWGSCPLKAKYHYIEGLDRRQSAAASFGTCVHDALDHYHKYGYHVEGAIERFKRHWDNPELLGVAPDYYLPRTSYGGYRERGITMISEYHEKRKWDKRHLIASEHKFCVPFGDYLLHGYVDWIEFRRGAKGEPQLVIGDLKTGTKKPYQSDLLFDVQFTTYLAASERKEFWTGYGDGVEYPGMENGETLYNTFAGVDRKAMWFHLYTAQEIYAGDRTQADYNRMYRCIEEVAKALERDVFVPCISGSTCGFCDYSETCVALDGLTEKIRQDKDQVC